MIRFILILLATSAMAEEVPSWVLVGILRVETNSYYLPDGSIRYVDQRRGRAGERSAFQITYGAFRQVRRKGEQFWQVETDQAFAEVIAIRYLTWLRARCSSWERAVEGYNAGPRRRAASYLAAVRSAGEAP